MINKNGQSFFWLVQLVNFCQICEREAEVRGGCASLMLRLYVGEYSCGDCELGMRGLQRNELQLLSLPRTFLNCRTSLATKKKTLRLQLFSKRANVLEEGDRVKGLPVQADTKRLGHSLVLHTGFLPG